MTPEQIKEEAEKRWPIRMNPAHSKSTLLTFRDEFTAGANFALSDMQWVSVDDYRKVWYIAHRATGDLPSHWIETTNGEESKSLPKIGEIRRVIESHAQKLLEGNNFEDLKHIQALYQLLDYMVSFCTEMRHNRPLPPPVSTAGD